VQASHTPYFIAAAKAWKHDFYYSCLVYSMTILSIVHHKFDKHETLSFFEEAAAKVFIVISFIKFRKFLKLYHYVLAGTSYVFFWLATYTSHYWFWHTMWHLLTGWILLDVITCARHTTYCDENLSHMPPPQF